MNLEQWYPFFWSLIVVLAWLITILLEIYDQQVLEKSQHKRTKLRDKAHFAHTQNRGCA